MEEMKMQETSKSVIEERQKNEDYQYFTFGSDYYVARNTAIMERKKDIYLEGIGVTANPFGANHKLPSGHFKKIVDQKVLYLLGEGVNFAKEGQNDLLDPYFETSLDETIIDIGLSASKKGEAWLYAYKKGEQTKFVEVPAEQLFPVFDEYGELSVMYRMFVENGKDVLLEIDKQQTIRYEKNKKGKFVEVDRYGHYTEFKDFSGTPVGEPIQHGFGVVPFLPLYNNREHKSDLYPIKPLIDVYDIISSDFANNIDDMQDAFYTLKGYSGVNTDLGEFMKQLKMYKAIPVGDEGEVTAQQLVIPVQARQVFLERLEKDIYKFAMAVDLSGMQGGSITNVYIKAMFADLDLKCDMFENEVRRFVIKMLDFLEATEGKKLEQEFNFERSMIVNRTEMVDTLIKLDGILSQETIRELLPFDIDLEQEKERLDEESKPVLKPFVEEEFDEEGNPIEPNPAMPGVPGQPIVPEPKVK